MACLCRIKQTRVNRLVSQLKRSYCRVSAPSLSDYICQTRLPSNSNRQQILGLLGSSNGFSVRFFAAPVQSKKKEEANKSKGPRLNEQIKSHMVRLVSDEGHEIVPFHVALDRARSINYDLVEVNSTAKPIVCKIMDYHRDKYQQQLKVKERSKNKAETSVRKGSCKEVRISLKIEQKDLEMKADMAKRLMERGYRVKCTVQGPSVSEEDLKARAAMDQKLKGLIDRLHALIEEVAFVESGPRVEKNQAFVLVRHIKFGPSKKGGKKAAKSSDSPTRATSGASGPVHHPANVGLEMASQHSGLGSDEEEEEDLSDDSDAVIAEEEEEEEVYDLGDDQKIAFTVSDQEKETVSPIVDSYSPETTPVENSMGPKSSENRYSRQNLTTVGERAQITEALNSVGPLENWYSRRLPDPAQQPPKPGLGNKNERSYSGDPDATAAEENIFGFGHDLNNASRVSGQVEEEVASPYSPQMPRASENRYSRQNVTRTEGEGYVRPIRDRAQITQAPNFTGPSENRYSRRPSQQQQQPPFREIPKKSPTSDRVPSIELTNVFSGFLSRDVPKNADASSFGFTKPPSSTTRLPRYRPPINGPDSPSTDCTNILSGLLNSGGLKNANATSVFGSVKTQGLRSAQPNAGSPVTDKAEIFSGLFSAHSSTSANVSPFGFKKTQVPPNVQPHPDSPETENTDPFSKFFDGDGSDVKASRIFPTKRT